jgi:arylsulfatase A-like enzyme
MKNSKSINLVMLGAISSLFTSAFAQKQARPNIVIILADDMGHGDLSCTGSDTPTPNIDKIFSNGVRFQNFMTCNVSSPTRAGLLTGINPLRIGQAPEVGGKLDPKITNIGNYFQKEGYKTGIFGKWHNGDSPLREKDAVTVNQYGFDRFVGFYNGGIDYFSKAWTGWYHDDKLVENEMEYSTDLISKYAIDFMTKCEDENKPFLCYVPFNAVHTPLNITEEALNRVPVAIRNKVAKMRSMHEYGVASLNNAPPFIKFNAEKYKDESWMQKVEPLTPEENAMLYSAVKISLDDNVGKILNHLQQTKQLNNTIVLFFSDNGGVRVFGNNAPFRGTKHTMYEGGIHSAAALMVPKAVLPNTVKEVPDLCGFLDVFPTFSALTKSKQPLPKNLDGISLVDHLKGTARTQIERYYYWNWRDHDVLRSNKWKLFRYANKFELYDMVNDISETKDIANENPLIVKQMLIQMNIEARKMNLAATHLPLPLEKVAPKPSKNCLKIEISSAEQAENNILHILNKEFKVLPDTYIEYDIKIETTSKVSYCYLTPLKLMEPLLKGTFGVDLTGKLLQSPTNIDQNWRHVAVGLSAFAPTKLAFLGLNYKFNGTANVLVYIDNIVVKNLNGELVQEIFIDTFNKNAFKAKNISIAEVP